MLCARAASGQVPARAGVLRLMDETQAAGLKLGVCSAATRSSAVAVMENLLGRERYAARPAAVDGVQGIWYLCRVWLGLCKDYTGAPSLCRCRDRNCPVVSAAFPVCTTGYMHG